ncbi:LicD family-domain-containing protein [Thelonectria olida]|uniref:LicD family-domain-containing protein n=1 Tax=Thelonectria olida TaxID=1576542 RepID=A0A9P8VRR0_9HYPO|nr:LicD family-domain-containing protein [Thelonectria olida]
MLVRIPPRNRVHLICLGAVLLLLATWAHLTLLPAYQGLKLQKQRPVIAEDNDARRIVHTMDGPLSASHPRYFPLSALSSHLDARFAAPTRPTAPERQAALTRLLRSFVGTMDDVGITTWLAHGSLLAWHWSARIFPWEWDLDVHVHLRGLEKLASCCLGSVYEYGTGEKYLLDVNAFVWERNGMVDPTNRIDARWIDLATGLYVDITAVEEADDAEEGVSLAAKDGHRYRKRNVLPLRVAWFEGVEVLVPWNATVLLEHEYGSEALVRKVFRG